MSSGVDSDRAADFYMRKTLFCVHDAMCPGGRLHVIDASSQSAVAGSAVGEDTLDRQIGQKRGRPRVGSSGKCRVRIMAL